MKKIFHFNPAFQLRFVCLLLIFVFLNFIHGCMFYYQVNTIQKPKLEDILFEEINGKYLILHSADSVWHINNLVYDSSLLSGKISVLPFNHMMYLKTIPDMANRFIRDKFRAVPYEGDVLNEVHLYTSDTAKVTDDRASVDFASLQKMEIYYYAKAKSRASWYVPLVGIPVLAVAGLAIVAALTSCPSIYIYDGNTWSFVGEIYGGATYPSLERDDYMILPSLHVLDGKYHLKISNELKEKQHTNLAELMLIKHPKDLEVLIDKYGNIQTLSMAQTPLSAITQNDRDYSQSLAAKDNKFFLFDEYNRITTMNSLIMTFENRNDASVGKLVVNARNSLWADYAYGKFTELFGTYYKKWDEKQKQISRDRQLSRALKQDIPLSIYLETDKGWEFIDYFNVVGPLTARDMVVPIDLTKAKSKDVRIKLESGFMFWELDYAAMDFSENMPVQTTILKPDRAFDEKGNDVTDLLYAADDQYLEQFIIGNETVVEYDVRYDSNVNKTYSGQTVILHSKGYYEQIRDYDSKPDWFSLMAMKRSHSFSEFSWKQFEQVIKEYGIVESK